MFKNYTCNFFKHLLVLPMGSRIQFISIIANWIWNCWIYTSCNIPVISNDNLQIYLIAYGRQINYKLAITNYSSLLRVFNLYQILYQTCCNFCENENIVFFSNFKSQSTTLTCSDKKNDKIPCNAFQHF